MPIQLYWNLPTLVVFDDENRSSEDWSFGAVVVVAADVIVKEVDKSKRPKEKKCPYCAKLFRRQKNFQEHIIDITHNETT